MSGKSVLIGTFALIFGVPSLRADVMGYIYCDPVGSSSVTLPGATGASVACGGESDLAQGSLEINVSPNLILFGIVSGELTIPAACDISQFSPFNPWWPPACPLPNRGENPNVGVYFSATVTATGYTEGPPRPGYLAWSVFDPIHGLAAEEPNWAAFGLGSPSSGSGLWAAIGPYSIQGNFGSCSGDGPDGYWSCVYGFAMPFELGAPFEVRYAFEGSAFASTHAQTVTFGAEVFNMRLMFLEADDVVPLEDTGYLIPRPGATPVPAHLVPEPTSLTLFGFGLALLVCAAVRQRRPG